jgi:hypothetical protein
VDLVERTRKISVFSADAEAAEGRRAAGMRVMCAVGAMGLLLAIPPLWQGLPAEALVLGVGGLAVATLAAGGFGWHDAECRVSSILSKTGAEAASAARRGWWNEHPTMWQALVASYRYSSPSPPSDYKRPPGLTPEEYQRACRHADEAARRWRIPFAAACVWTVLIAIAEEYLVAGDGSSGLFVLCSACWLPILLATPSGWMLRWRQRRDEVARAAGARNMRDFMHSLGWVRHPFLGCQWKRERPTPQ